MSTAFLLLLFERLAVIVISYDGVTFPYADRQCDRRNVSAHTCRREYRGPGMPKHIEPALTRADIIAATIIGLMTFALVGGLQYSFTCESTACSTSSTLSLSEPRTPFP